MKSFIYRTAWLPLLLCASFVYAGRNEASANNGKGSIENPYIIPRITSKIYIDGKLEEPAWQEALSDKIKQLEHWITVTFLPAPIPESNPK
jgi:hypothetical protein